MRIVRVTRSGSPAIASSRSNASMPGIDWSTRTTAYGAASREAGRRIVRAASPEPAVPASIPHPVRYPDRTSRCVALSSTISALVPASPSSWESTPFGACAASAGARTVNQNVLPSPTWLETPQPPPMSEISWPLMARPRPVPPYLRDVDVSACTNGWKIVVSMSGAMPSPPRGPCSAQVRRAGRRHR